MENCLKPLVEKCKPPCHYYSGFYCFQHEIKDINKVMLQAKSTIDKYSENYVRKLYYGGNYGCREGLEKDLEKLTTYLDKLLFVKKQMTSGYKPCMEGDTLQLLIEKVLSITGKNCKITCDDLWVDDSREEEWIKNNKYCLSYETYNKWAVITARDFDIKLKTEELKRDFILDIYTEVINNDILLAVSAVRQANEHKLSLKRVNKEQVKVHFDLLIEKLPDADITLDIYRTLIDNNISFDIIYEVYKNGLELTLDRLDGICLKSTLNSYPIKDLKLDLTKVNIDKKIEDYLSDYNL